MSNLVKSAYVIENESENRVIDSNEMIAEKLRELTERMEAELAETEEEFDEEFTEGLNADQMEGLMGDRDAEAESSAAHSKLEDAKAELARLQEQADMVVEDAKAQADALIAQAQEDAKAIEAQARDDGHAEGYDAGYKEAMDKVAQEEARLAAREEELEQAYEAQMSEMEPKLMGQLCDIFSHVFNVDMTGRSDVVHYLLVKAMQNIEGGTNFLVHVSPEDHAYAAEHKDALSAYVSPAGTLELVEDHTLKQGQCYIETESGIFDCSFGVEMELLTKEIRLLSYSET
ncbi:MAG: hypothetical protein J5518_02450 [Lachnospiraceae bacterium]|nr:hypothetical protein [Lachnospiraceae bacterium]